MPKPLKYLFTAAFTDGSTVEQDANDTSKIDPLKRTAFTDVLKAIESGKVLSTFTLTEQGPVANKYAVDLRDGSFAINGKSFRMHEGTLSLEGVLRIIYFRNNTRTFYAQSGEDVSHDVVYRIGWQYTMNGTNYQQVMEID